MTAIGSQVTALLDRWSGGDREALDELIPLIFEDVRELARRHLAHGRRPRLRLPPVEHDRPRETHS